MRQLELLTLLKSRATWTVATLARELEVSVRTVLRDLDALETQGVRLTRTPGPGGGVALHGDEKVFAPTLEAREVRALAAVATPTALASPLVQRALAKLSANLPAAQRAELDRAKNRLHVDTSGWFDEDEAAAWRPSLERATWEQRRVRLHTTTFDERALVVEADPLGLVVKAERWYLLARTERGLRSFRLDRLSKVEVLTERFERPPRFDLADAWQAQVAHFRQTRPRFEVTFTLRARDVEVLKKLRPRSDWPKLKPGRVTLDFERERIARETLGALKVQWSRAVAT